MHPLSAFRHIPTMLRRKARPAILLAALVLIAASAQAQTVYVDGSNPAASDLNIGHRTSAIQDHHGRHGPQQGRGGHDPGEAGRLP
jgi:hypothetical protein